MSPERDDPPRPSSSTAPSAEPAAPSAKAAESSSDAVTPTGSSAPTVHVDLSAMAAASAADALPPVYHEPLPEAEAAGLIDDYPTRKNEGSRYDRSYRPSDGDEEDAPPPYSEDLGRIDSFTEGLTTQAAVADDGRVNIHINEKSPRLANLLAPALRSQYELVSQSEPLPPPYIPPSLGGLPGQTPPPPMNVVIQVVGSRGDVQPFVALGKVLKDTYGHRVRLATHPTFKKFVEENGLEFFSIGGDPAQLMAFMVKNPGLMPGFDSLRKGDVGKRRKEIADMVKGCWRSCIETGDGSGVAASDSTFEEWMENDNITDSTDVTLKPFVADAIIANPPSFAHIHCAEKLGVPLHMMFTMPWSATQQFPHPLANIKSSNTDVSMSNFMSYALVDMLTWQGLGDVINRFRRDSLGLEPVSLMWAPGMLARLRIPWTYCWSPALIPKPKDWGNFISISGFYFLNLASNYTPDPALAEFLAAGDPPVYIGFGSIVVDDPNAMTDLIFEAVAKTGQRALVSKGWGGFGTNEMQIPSNIFMLGNVPHDWLFKQVSCVVHHGGAGTTAAGIACGRPTVVVPFFGDQPFWGSMVARAGAGPEPIPNKQLTADKLAAAIMEALKPSSQERAKELAAKISDETGCDTGAQSFHQMLKVDDLRCAVAPSRVAVWRIKRTNVRLSPLAVTVLVQEGEIRFSDLKLYRSREYLTDGGPWDPITGGASAVLGTVSTMMMGVADFPAETFRALRFQSGSRPKKKSKGKTKDKENEIGDESVTLTGSSAATTSVTTNLTSEPASTTDLRNNGTLSPTRAVNGLTAESPSILSPAVSTSSISHVSEHSERGTFMSQAMRQHSEGSRSRRQSPSGHGRSPSGHDQSPSGHARSPSHHDRSNSDENTCDASKAVDAAIDTTKGITRIVGAGVRAPMDLSLAVTRGFHNAARLYGEEPRHVDKVTGIKSGLKTSGKEFAVGLYEGLAGVVRDPYKGAKEKGAKGFFKGVGTGLAGLTLKHGAAAFALPAYTFQGIYKELSKPFGPSIQNYIIAARTAQGYDDFIKSSEEERADILQRWRCMKPDIKKKKNPAQEQLDVLHTALERHREKMKEKSKWKGKDPIRGGHAGKFDHQPQHVYMHPELEASSYTGNSSSMSEPAMRASHDGSIRSSVELSTGALIPAEPRARATSTAALSAEGVPAPGEPLHHANTYPSAQRPTDSGRQAQTLGPYYDADEEEQMEEALRKSLVETRSMPVRTDQVEDEDKLIERAIQASIAELERAPRRSEDLDDEGENEALQRALTASMDEAERSGANEEEQKILEEVLRRSVTETKRQQQYELAHDGRHRSSDSEWDSDSEDEFYQTKGAITPKGSDHTTEKASLSTARTSIDPASGSPEAELEEAEQLRKALDESMREEQEKQKERTEEEIVMEYVKKMSLVEEEHRRRLLQGREEAPKEGEGSNAREH